MEGTHHHHHHHKREVETNAEPTKDSTNPYTGRPYSANYKTILGQRQKLPVYEFKSDIINTVKNNKVTIIEGSTGSGKTTQIPQFLLEAGITDKKILCTQPRRVAAINVATRVAQEMDLPLGGIVGYTVRFDSKTSEETRLIYMTDGLLMKEFINDPNVNQYGIILIDEAHERNINSDIILGLLKQLVQRRDDIHVVVMSATLEANKFTGFYNDAPHLVIPGRLHPVDIIYEKEAVPDYLRAAITRAIKIHEEEPPGDILIFLTGEEEIEMACQRIRDGTRNSRSKMSSYVLPLYASLQPKEQQKVFIPAKNPNTRKIIVATNIAETSVTIDGVVYVIDPGFVKQSQYQPDRKMYALLVTPISQAAATQRCGRAGRTRPGKCYRLYTEAAFKNQLLKQTKPEIQRSDLSALILTMLATGIKDLVHFPFIDAPPSSQLASALQELYHLGAVNGEGQLTDIGRLISLLPVEPKHAKSLIASKKFGCTNEMATLIALLSEQGQVFIRPNEKRSAADASHSQFKSGYGDHISLINVYDEFVANGSDRKWCDDNYVNYRVLSRAERSRGQLISLLQKYDIEIVSIPRENVNRERLILRALLEGLFMQIAMLNPSSGNYLQLEGTQEASIHPSSCLKRKPEWIVYSDYVFTSNAYLRTISEIQPEWLFEASPTYFEPSSLMEGQIKRALTFVMKRIQEKDRFK